jgi:nucleoside-diphosphate-sugar epimerase
MPQGVGMRVANLSDVQSVVAAVGPEIDAVIHAATPLGDWTLERRVVSAAMHALGAPDKKFVYVSGVWVLGPSTESEGATRAHHEASPVNPIALVAGRESLEAEVLNGKVTGIVVRPGVLHGRGAGIPRLMANWAAQRGHGVFVGEDDYVTWACVHVEDAARLIATAVEAGAPAPILHAVSETAVPAAAIAAAADQSVGGAGVAIRWDPREAADEIGPAFSEALGLTQRVESRQGSGLGWRPIRPGVVDDLRAGSYGSVSVSA